MAQSREITVASRIERALEPIWEDAGGVMTDQQFMRAALDALIVVKLRRLREAQIRQAERTAA
ncbi:hypothetical protein JDN40_14445 [Rhodomicrobium vannielii ATCC 17100]|uniref:hypothetical protein n=1 Tax=Rhodomicrobium vannielii TaxID=1069 RepID=UPI00191ACC60|nr:hypothetical protein [Rhodomicrobium vannielii]MBJ7535308.1 hypothetical protein [Rhodomicrobium vannielii ATCC 17100]